MLINILKYGYYLLTAITLLAGISAAANGEYGTCGFLSVFVVFFGLTAWCLGTLTQARLPSNSGRPASPEREEVVPTANILKEDEGVEMTDSKTPEYPEDGITDTLHGLNTLVWGRGYYHKTGEGVWYELYVNDSIKEEVPSIDVNDEDWEYLANFTGLILDHYEDDGQITFFVPDGEEDYTLEEMADMFV